MNPDELTRLCLYQAAELLAVREISPLDLTRAFLERIERIEPRVNSYITLTADLALESARKAEKAFRSLGKNEGNPLLGIPLSLKDLFETRGVKTTAGSKFFRDYVPEKDAFVVERLTEAGAVILGKTNMHEIALGLTSNNPHYGACRNPWDLQRIPGGSSGGSAAAIAAGLCMASLGTDTGGSIRVPASLCGVVGLKPTRGLVSLRGVIPLSWNLDHAGPMGRCVRDVALLLQTIAGYDPLDPYSIRTQNVDYISHLGGGVRGKRIAVAQGEYFDRAETEVREAVHKAALVFAELGAHVEQVPFPEAYQAAFSNGKITISDASVFHKTRLENQPQDFGEDVRQRLQAGAELPKAEYIQARHTQALLRRDFERFFESYDFLLMPSTAIPASEIEAANALEQAKLLTRFTAPFNLTGLPAISIPCGFTAGNLPIGLQIIAAPWEEAQLLSAAYAFEQATDFHLKMLSL